MVSVLIFDASFIALCVPTCFDFQSSAQLIFFPMTFSATFLISKRLGMAPVWACTLAISLTLDPQAPVAVLGNLVGKCFDF